MGALHSVTSSNDQFISAFSAGADSDYSMAAMEDVGATKAVLPEYFEECLKLYRQTWTSLHNELQQSLKDEADERRKMALKQMNIEIKKKRMEAETAANSKHRLVAKQEMKKNISDLRRLQIADSATVDALKPLCSEETIAESEALRKEGELLSKILSLELLHCPTSGILSAVYKEGDKLIPHHVVTTGKEPYEIADELWKFDEECSIKK